MYKNIYYNPEAFGATTVAHASVLDLSYAFDEFVVWRVGDRFYWAADSGCSCPVPFEDTTLETAASGKARDALIDLLAWVKEKQGLSYEVGSVSAVESLTDLISQGL